MALQELKTAFEFVTTSVREMSNWGSEQILFGAIFFAIAFAFGLGNRDLAGENTRELYSRMARRATTRSHAGRRGGQGFRGAQRSVTFRRALGWLAVADFEVEQE